MDIRQQIQIVNSAICRVTELYGIWAKKNGMSYNTMMTLYALNQNKVYTQKQISDEWLIPKQTVNTVVKDLEKQGFIRFEHSNNDKKQKIIILTEKGKSFADEKLKSLYKMEENAMMAMGEDKRKMLIDGNLAFLEFFENEVFYE